MVKTVLLVIMMVIGLSGFDQPTAVGQTPPQVTSDTRDYCDQLLARVHETRPLPDTALQLSNEGQDMCQHGQVRGGIARLRRALMIIRETAGR